ncbi:hypothetical protein [Streptomyces fodineus]|uniref:hypothetical protein n=1 Tax=Streptomyces fodineus TaxID=1904616 RepID=UPI00131D29FA|nr:hypothetical protein [Streptomyces fodineus]
MLASNATAAVASLPKQSPSAASTTSEHVSKSTEKQWDKHGPYLDEQSCRKAGEGGAAQGAWQEFKCLRVYNVDQYRYDWRL